jgi:two-component system, OmpR family, sensor histidine kinase KdpD
VQEIVQNALDRAAALLQRHAVEVRLDSNLPPLLVDAASIGGVVFELLENAAKYSPAGSAIHVIARAAGADQAQVGVEDEGSGIPRHLRARVFDKFFRAPASHEGRGFGLGLAIARGIVEAHGGRIWVEDASGRRGTAVWFTVPCQTAVPHADSLSAHTRGG